ncbi:MAG: Hpt domain-containing protein [Anaerotardibacter sp.]
MTLEECYAEMDGNLEEARALLSDDELIRESLLIFLKDSSMELLRASVTNSNRAEAFRAVHTLKVACQYLGFAPLFEISNELTELLQGEGEMIDISEKMIRIEKAYAQTIAAIQKFV